MICARAGRFSQQYFSVFSSIFFACIAVLFTALTANAATITVPAGGSLQSAINAAQPGDTIILDAGASYTGPITLPNKSGSTFITIQSSALAQLPGPTERVTAAHASLMPKILTPGANQPALQTAASAHHYRFIGIEFAPVNATVIVSDLIKFGEGSSLQNSLSLVPHHLVLDRCYIHGFPAMELKRGVALNSADTDILNSHISEVHGQGYDTQAICGWNGPGPFRIINNRLEAAGENVMFGGADPSITGLIPSDITISQNYFFKPLSWKVDDPSYGGIHWTVKNLLETKNAQRVLVDGNLFENIWPDAQVGFAILLKSNNQDSTAPWSVTADLTFSNNVIRNAEHGLNILAVEIPPKVSDIARNLRIVNNFWDVNKIWYQGSNGAQNLVFEHNTFFSKDGNTANFYGLVTQGFVFRNNLGVDAGYGMKGDGTGEGIAALNLFCPGWIFEKNVIVGAPAAQYPVNNFYPGTLGEVGFVDMSSGNYRLSTSSQYRNAGTDGKDIGVDFDALNAAMNGTPDLTPISTPTPTPTPVSTPTPTPTPTPAPSPLAKVAFVQSDATTKGTWKTTYGADGFNTINDMMKYPSYAQVSVIGNSSPTWTAATTDVRGLQKTSGTDRIAARWESNSFFSIDVNLTDGLQHRVAIYGVDWDGNNRSQRVDVVDWATNVLLDSRSISSFNGGQYLVWDVRGRVKLIVNKVGGKSAVVSGIYFGDAATAPSPTPTPTPTPAPGAPQVTLTVPTDGATFVAGDNITLAATASDPGGAVSKVEFYQGSTLLGTDTTGPYNFVWNNVAKGNYNLTAKATDNTGLSTTSAVVSITVTNSPNSVDKAKGRAGTLVQQADAQTQAYAGAADTTTTNTALASDINALTADIQQAYFEFESEGTAFGANAPAIDSQLTAALLFSKATSGLALRAASSPNIKNNLLRVTSHLAIAEDLMRFGRITKTTLDQATATNTRTNVVVGLANVGYGLSAVSSIAPSSLGAISGVGNAQPMIGQTKFASLQSDGTLPYEVAGLSVTVSGVAVPVLYASPWGVKFFMPPVSEGIAEVIVSSQDGYICQGLVSVERNGSRIVTTNDDDNGFAVIGDNQTVITSNFNVTSPGNFGTDKRTRLSFFASGISGSVSNTVTSNDVNVNGNIRPNLAEGVAVEARVAATGQIYMLPVQFAGAQGVLPGLDQVTVMLVPELKGSGAVQLTLIVNGRRSGGAPTVFIN